MSRRWLDTFEVQTPRLMSDLEALVRLESPSDEPERVTALARWVGDRLRERGVSTHLRPCAPAGDTLLASVGPEGGGTLLLGHLDTVWPAGTLASRPWQVGGGRASGPGVFDMKAGIAVGMAVLAALVRSSPPPAVTLLLVPDEETGSRHSRELTVDVARRHRQVLVLEPSADGAAKVARKACGVFRVRFRGRAAHAGLEPEQGASALAELARLVLRLEEIALPEEGTTLVAGRARAGSAVNVVPAAAEVEIDARAWSRDEMARVTTALQGYRPSDPRVTADVEGGFDRPPLEPTSASQALFERARSLAAELGFELGQARVGGGSDGNFTADAGVATLDGLGPAGGGAHAPDEHVLVAELPRRAALVAALCELA